MGNLGVVFLLEYLHLAREKLIKNKVKNDLYNHGNTLRIPYADVHAYGSKGDSREESQE